MAADLGSSESVSLQLCALHLNPNAKVDNRSIVECGASLSKRSFHIFQTHSGQGKVMKLSIAAVIPFVATARESLSSGNPKVGKY